MRVKLNPQHPKLKQFAAESHEPVHRLVYSMREFADACGVHYATIQRMVAKGLIGVIRGGSRKLLIPIAEVERFLREHVTYNPPSHKGGLRRKKGVTS
jgi:excisionase family DNA binding protein